MNNGRLSEQNFRVRGNIFSPIHFICLSKLERLSHIQKFMMTVFANKNPDFQNFFQQNRNDLFRVRSFLLSENHTLEMLKIQNLSEKKLSLEKVNLSIGFCNILLSPHRPSHTRPGNPYYFWKPGNR